MIFDDEAEHQIINSVSIEEPLCYDVKIDIPDSSKFIKDVLKIKYKKDKDGKDTDEVEDVYFVIKEQETWWNFPLYEFKDGEIIPFNYKDYQYFQNTDRRMALADKISSIYHLSSEIKILRKTLKYIMDNLEIPYPDFFKKYNDKIEEIINKNPKN